MSDFDMAQAGCDPVMSRMPDSMGCGARRRFDDGKIFMENMNLVAGRFVLRDARLRGLAKAITFCSNHRWRAV
jgi:hypothetical protein